MTAAAAGRDDQSLRAEVRRLVDEWRDAGRFHPRCDAWLRSVDRDFTRALGQRGWIGMTWPTDYGGGARSNLERLVVTEELLRAGAPVALHWIADRQIGPAILRYGSAELKYAFLPGIAAGEISFCLGMSETEAGSDLAAVRTRAVADGDGWRVTGHKLWTSQAHHADYAYVLARTGDGGKHDGLTELIVDLAADGVAVRPIIDLQGEHHFNEMIFTDVAVPPGHVIGEVGAGWSQVTEQLAFERGGPERVLSTYPLLQALLEVVTTGGDGGDGHAAIVVAELVARLDGLCGLTRDIAEALDAGEAPAQRAAMLKQLGTAFEVDVVDAARAVLGIEADPLAAGAARLLAEAQLAAPGFTIRGGTTEMLDVIVARGETA